MTNEIREQIDPRDEIAEWVYNTIVTERVRERLGDNAIPIKPFKNLNKKTKDTWRPYACQILSLIQPLIDQAKAGGKREVIEWIKEYETPTIKDLHLIQFTLCIEDWQALKG